MFLSMVRHGQSEGNVSGIAGLDPPMTETGHTQITLAAQRLQSMSITHVYCSPLYRALQTASIYRERLSLEPEIDPVYCEIWGTGWNARTRTQLCTDFPWANLPGSMEERWWPQIAETEQGIRQRSKQALHGILHKHKESDRVCLVAHVMFGNALIKELLRIPIELDVHFDIRNGSFTEVRFEKGEKQIVRSINDISHLPENLWT